MRFRAVLTGASGGIGRAMAAALAPHCDSLVLVGRDKARLTPLDGKSFPLAADITTAQGRDAVASAAPGINLLINNAGVSEFVAFAAQSDASMERMFAVNVLAAMQLTRRLLPALLAQPAAMVVNVGSIMGYLGYPGCAAYSASKFALRGFSEALRRELADTRVRVMYLAPRTTRTAMNSAALDALNVELGNAADAPAAVALQLMSFLEKPAGERLIGMPEALFARVNQLAPALVDAALRRQLPIVRRHLAKETAMRTLCIALALSLAAPAALAAGLDEEVRALQLAWDEVKYRRPAAEQEVAYEQLARVASGVRARHAGRAEPEIWYGIIVASQAGAKGGLGALSLVKEAKRALEHALAIDPDALDGSAYASLGSLYYQVPGWPLGFGDDQKARELLQRALIVNPDGIDPNYFLGDFLYRKGNYAGAREALQRALKAPPRPARPLADEGRRREIESLLKEIRAKSS